MRTTNYCACHDSSFVDGVFIPQGAAQSLAEKIAYPPRRAPIATWREKLTDNVGRSDKREAPSRRVGSEVSGSDGEVTG